MRKVFFLFLLLLGGNVWAQEKSLKTYLDESGETDSVKVFSVEDWQEENDSIVMPPKDPPFLRTIPEAELNAKKNDPAFVYANDPAYWEKKKTKRKSEGNFWAFLGTKTFRWIIYGLMGIIFLTALYFFIVKQKLSFFTPRSRKKHTGGEEAFSPESIIDYKLLWKEAEANRDWRMALRYRFLQLLLDLDQKGMIRFSPDAPNSLYTRQLAGNIPAEKGEEPVRLFRQLVKVYEYSWYGNLPLEESRYLRSVEQIGSFSKNGAL
ncbi:MAG: hypothetical protein ACO1NW_17370 [Chitinophagaceae bacterium]